MLQIDQTEINILFGIFSALIGWLMRTMTEAIRELKIQDRDLVSKVSNLEVLVAGQYVKRDEYERMASAMFNKLDKMDDSIKIVLAHVKLQNQQ